MKKLVIASLCGTLVVGSWMTAETLAQTRNTPSAMTAELGTGVFAERLAGKLARLSWTLDLDDAQRAEVRAIVEAALPEAQVLAQALRTNRQDLLQGSQGGAFDEGFVRTIADAQGELLAELIVLKESTKADIYGVLNPAQQLMLDELLANWFQRWEG